MSEVVFKTMAGFALLFAAILCLGGVLTIARYPPRSPWDLVPLTALVAALVVAGVGLFYLRKWAALLISLIALYGSTWEVKDALHPVPGYANWLGFLFAVLLAVPSILTVVYWRTLTWRRQANAHSGTN